MISMAYKAIERTLRIVFPSPYGICKARQGYPKHVILVILGRLISVWFEKPEASPLDQETLLGGLAGWTLIYCPHFQSAICRFE